jgi:hypothetical protein
MKKIVSLILVSLVLCGCSGNGGNNSGSEQLPKDPTELVKRAKAQTVDLKAYQYDFDLSAKIKFKSAASFSPATYSGTTYVNVENDGTQFLQRRELSGALVIDSTNFIYNVGTDLIKISADEDKDFSVVNHETVDSVYDFDKHNFGQILKTLNDDGYIKVEQSGEKYNLSLKPNFNQDSLLGMLNHIDSKLILKALNKYTKAEWGVGFSVNTWVTLSQDKNYLSTFHFDASVTIKDTFEIGFEFNQRFTKYSGVDIELPTFSNTLINEADVTNELNNVKQIVNTAKNAASSYYDYTVKTTVDHGVSKTNPLGLAVNSTTKGFAKRQVSGNDVFFNNRLMVDSDYKNKDQLGDLVADYDSYRARLNNANKDVYDVLDPKVGFNKYNLLDGYNESDIDNYYMLPSVSMLSYSKIKVLKKTTDSQSNTIYKFGLSTEAVKDLLSYYNKSIRIDFNRTTIFDIYNIKEDFIAKKAQFTYITDSSGRLSEVSIDLKGFYTEKETEDQVKFRLETSIKYDWAKSYTAVSTKEDIDN